MTGPVPEAPRVEPAGEVSAAESLAISSIVLRINDRVDLVVDRDTQVVELAAGDQIQVVAVHYSAQLGTEGLQGVLATEAYINKLPWTDAPSQIDYEDGRFGAASAQPIVAGHGTLGELDGVWEVEAGWDRLTLVLNRYWSDQSAVEDTFVVRLQVGRPDFVINEKLLDRFAAKHFRVGRTVRMKGEWANTGNGRYHNYMEVDIYDAADTTRPVWVGVLVGNASRGDTVRGELINDNPHDAFAKRWTPEKPGRYLVLAAVDPERLWNESDETGNRLRRYIEVRGARSKRPDGFEQAAPAPALQHGNQDSPAPSHQPPHHDSKPKSSPGRPVRAHKSAETDRDKLFRAHSFDAVQHGGAMQAADDLSKLIEQDSTALQSADKQQRELQDALFGEAAADLLDS